MRRETRAGRTDLVVPAAKFNRAQRIDTKLVAPLHDLPEGSIGPPNVPDGDERRNLAYRNLTRANTVSLATGQQMAAFMRSKGVGVTTLTKAQSATATAVSPSMASARSSVPAWSPIRRFGSTSCARPS